MNEFVSWCRHLLVSFLFHALTSLHPPSFYRNDFSTCIYIEQNHQMILVLNIQWFIFNLQREDKLPKAIVIQRPVVFLI